jgi:hypothetical protein
MVDKVSAPFDDKPQVAAVVHRMLIRLTEANAINYLDELPALARAQGGGTKAGELKSSFGFGLKDAMQELTQSPARNLLAAVGSVTSPVQLFIALMQMNFSFHMHSQEQRKDGMMLKMTQETVTTAHAFSYDLRKTESKTITMTPAP